MSTSKIQAIRGMNDLLPTEIHWWEHLEDTAREVFRLYGYRQIRTPIIEATPLFIRSVGEHTDIVEKEMYSFVDELNGEKLTLRPEGTAGCVRAVIEHNLLYSGPQKLWYSGPMFRHERPQKGRYRQFYQIGAEALGLEGPDIDAEIILMMATLWEKLGLADIELHLNSIGDAAARAQHRQDLIRYFERHQDLLDADAKRRLYTNPLRTLDTKNPAMQDLANGAPKLMAYLDDAALNHYENVKTLLRANQLHFTENSRLVRGFDYYNRTVFEFIPRSGAHQLTIGGGGRYDQLIVTLGGKTAPACGFGIGMERVLLLLQAQKTDNKPPLQVYLAYQGERATQFAWQVTDLLRRAGISVQLHLGGGSFKSQMKRADTSLAEYAILIGEEEAAQQEVTVKPLRTYGESAVGSDSSTQNDEQQERPPKQTSLSQQRMSVSKAIDFLSSKTN